MKFSPVLDFLLLCLIGLDNVSSKSITPTLLTQVKPEAEEPAEGTYFQPEELFFYVPMSNSRAGRSGSSYMFMSGGTHPNSFPFSNSGVMSTQN